MCRWVSVDYPINSRTNGINVVCRFRSIHSRIDISPRSPAETM